ncbi:MAG: Tim44/TimA family putative adaptor protein [Pelagibacteraceae bacterium]
MSNNFGYIDIILLAMIAGFIILRLRNILGRRTGHEDKSFTSFAEKKLQPQNKEFIKKEFPKESMMEEEQKEEFLKGAEIAYESIITSFAKGESKKLKPLLSEEMFANFESAINEREKNKIKSELTFIGIKETQLEKFEKIKNELYATVKFVSEIISVKKDSENKIIEGNPDKIKLVTDHWKFSKNIFNSNPNWHLSEIVSK